MYETFRQAEIVQVSHRDWQDFDLASIQRVKKINHLLKYLSTKAEVKVEYEITITWENTKNFGIFVDQLLTVEGIIIEKI